MKQTTEERFLSHVSKGFRCWAWTGAKVRGYGQFQVSSYKTVRAHRWAYEHWVGSIPPGLTIDHRCRNRACVRPSHLRPMTRGENTLTGDTITAANLKKTHCPKGHPLSGPNLMLRPARKSGRRMRKESRECRLCSYGGAR
jgi:hypothetical protein